MTPETVTHAPRRVLLGLGEMGEPRPAIAAATRLASRFGMPVECLLVKHPDVMAAACLPFACAVGPGGLAMPFSSDLLERHFRRFARLVERDLLALCSSARLSWRLQQREGTLRASLADAMGEGDLVVIGPRDLRSAGDKAPGLLRDLLAKASAVVVPGRQMMTERSSRLIPDGDEWPEFVRLLAAALGVPARGSRWRSAGLIATRLEDLERDGEARFLRLIERTGAAAVILPRSSGARALA